MITLRPYQQRTINEIWQWFRENKEGNPLAVLPTGAGKSIICAKLIEEAIGFASAKPIRVLVVTHSKELIEQNYSKFVAIAPSSDVGVFSAGLKRRDTSNQVLFAGVQSIYNKEAIGSFDLMIVDECHLIPKSGDGRYLTLINRLKDLNPSMRVIGLTATPYRLSCGYLHKGEGRLFNDIATEVTLLELLKLGFLSPVISKRPAITADLSGVNKTAGEFNQKQAAERMTAGNLTDLALSDVIQRCYKRVSWLIFCVSVEHAHEVSDWLNGKGIKCAVISGETPPQEREYLIAEYKAGRLQALANCEVLTTGFDAPRTDLIVMLRPTESTALYQQMAGRGMRIFEGKTDCLLLDYAGNVERHGCLDDPYVNVPKQAKGKGSGIAPTKYCPCCDTALPASTKTCSECAHEFPKSEVRLAELASQHAVLSTHREPILKLFDISRVRYVVHAKTGSPNSVKVTYFGNESNSNQLSSMFQKEIVSEWVCIEHEGFAQRKAANWWGKWVQTPIPKLAEDAVMELQQGQCKKPKQLIVDVAGKYPEVKEFIEEI